MTFLDRVITIGNEPGGRTIAALTGRDLFGHPALAADKRYADVLGGYLRSETIAPPEGVVLPERVVRDNDRLWSCTATNGGARARR